MKKRSSLLVLALAWVLLVPAPALSQTSPDGSSGAQFDQYGSQGPGIGDQAAHDAIVASDAIRASSDEDQAAEANAVSEADLPSASSELNAAIAEESNADAQDESASTAEAQNESASTAEAQDESASTAEAQIESANTADLTKLPDTGGLSPLWLGVPLVCVGSLLARRIFSP